jgi:transposase-like protein
VDSRGQTIDFLLSAKRDVEAAKRFFRKALGQPHTVNPRTITVDKNAAYPKAVTEMKADGELWRFSRLLPLHRGFDRLAAKPETFDARQAATKIHCRATTASLRVFRGRNGSAWTGYPVVINAIPT